MMKMIEQYQKELTQHPVYSILNSVHGIRHFMRFHVFAVWDFMSLLKSLQRQITCVDLPWMPSAHPPEMVRLINQIVLGEESDLDELNQPISHFELYLKAMDEVGADRSSIDQFLKTFNLELIPSGAREFVVGNLDVARKAQLVEVAAYFFFGREKLIPSMFESMVKVLEDEGVQAPTFKYYLERHIAVDQDEHGPAALKCFEHLSADPINYELGVKAAVSALKARKKLWDATLVSFYETQEQNTQLFV